jgi:hypothetical protein
MSVKNNVHGDNSNIDLNHNVFANIYSKTPGAAISFDECSSFLCFDKDLRVRDCLFVRCGSNGGNGGTIWFNGDDVILERDAIFDCEAVQMKADVSGIFGYFNLDDDSTINQITAVRTSPDKSHLHYVNEQEGSVFYSVFTLNVDREDPYYFRRINKTDCFGVDKSICLRFLGGSSKSELTQSIFVNCFSETSTAMSDGFIYFTCSLEILFSSANLNHLYFINCKDGSLFLLTSCIYYSSVDLICNYCYFVMCQFEKLIYGYTLSDDTSISNCFQYLCSNKLATDKIQPDQITVLNDPPQEKMDGLVETIPFPHLALFFGITYSGFCPDMDITIEFSPSNKFSPTSRFLNSLSFSSTRKFESSFHFSKTQ